MELTRKKGETDAVRGQSTKDQGAGRKDAREEPSRVKPKKNKTRKNDMFALATGPTVTGRHKGVAPSLRCTCTVVSGHGRDAGHKFRHRRDSK